VPDHDIQERVLIMDNLTHNRYDPRDPDNLLYDYEKIFGVFTEYIVQEDMRKSSITTLTLGGGACLFPAYLEIHYPGSHNEVVEIDPKVWEIA